MTEERIREIIREEVDAAIGRERQRVGTRFAAVKNELHSRMHGIVDAMHHGWKWNGRAAAQ